MMYSYIYVFKINKVLVSLGIACKSNRFFSALVSPAGRVFARCCGLKLEPEIQRKSTVYSQRWQINHHITVSLYSSFLISRIQEHERLLNCWRDIKQFTRQSRLSEQLLKGNQTVHTAVEALRTTVCVWIHHGAKQEIIRQMWRHSTQRFIGSVLYFDVVDRGNVFEDGIDKQENRDEWTANFENGKMQGNSRINAYSRSQERHGIFRE